MRSLIKGTLMTQAMQNVQHVWQFVAGFPAKDPLEDGKFKLLKAEQLVFVLVLGVGGHSHNY